MNMFSFSLGKMLRSGLSGSNYIPNFIRNCQTVKLFSKVAFTSLVEGQAPICPRRLKSKVDMGGRRANTEYSTPNAALETEGQREARGRACAHPEKRLRTGTARVRADGGAQGRKAESLWLPQGEKFALETKTNKQKGNPLLGPGLRIKSSTMKCGRRTAVDSSHKAARPPPARGGTAAPTAGCSQPRREPTHRAALTQYAMLSQYGTSWDDLYKMQIPGPLPKRLHSASS